MFNPKRATHTRAALVSALLLSAWPSSARPAPPAERGGLGAPYGVRARGSRPLDGRERGQFERKLQQQRQRVQREAILDVGKGGLNRSMEHLVFGAPSDISANPEQRLIARQRYLSLYENKQPLEQPRPARAKLERDARPRGKLAGLTKSIADGASNVKRRVLGKSDPFKLGARWVAFLTEAADVLPEMERPDNRVWRGEDKLPKRFPIVRERWWKGLFRQTRTSAFHDDGVSRGHLADFGASKRSWEEAKSTFRLMTNAHGQWRDNNAGPWHTLERDIRHMAEQGYRIFQYAGPHWGPFTYAKRNGEETTVVPRALRRGKIPLPSAFWKVAVAVPGDKPLADAIGDARLFSVVVPNTKDVGIFASSWTRFSETPRAIEEMTGLKFFENLPDDIREGWLDHLDMREGFDVGHDIPREWKLPALRNVRKMGGLPQDQKAANELIEHGRITDH